MLIYLSKMWIIHAVLVHVALLGSIFVIYFRSPVITGLSPQNELENPPADRLVLIVTDGLRAESFFKNQCEDIPHIRKLIKRQGLVGVSQTRVPTESRPGHIALIAGLYEDPSAVLRGWKANPIDFDNVFNRSAQTYAWGAMDVLHIFSKITAEDRLMIGAYDEYDFTGKDQSSEVDQWVFKRVELFLKRKAQELKSKKRIVFFLHLLGLDIAGHIHKPGSQLFLDTLHSTEKGVYEIYEIFENIFKDEKTAYVLTSDHGMTNHGSHGSGHNFETDTPIFVWGAGIKNWQGPPKSERNIKIDDETIPLIDIEQGQVAPLMSTLIGLPPPMNSFGKLPKDILNVSIEYQASAVYTNALQLIEQFETLLKTFNRGALSNFLPSFKPLDDHSIKDFRKNVETYRKEKHFQLIIDDSYEIMQEALNGIEYYHSYYQTPLLFCTTLTFLLWMFCLITFFVSSSSRNFSVSIAEPVILSILVLAFIFLQGIPFEVGFYMILPVILWALSIRTAQGKGRWLRSLVTRKNLVMIIVISTMAILMVASFYRQEFITIVFLLFVVLVFKSVKKEGYKFYTWLALSLLVSIFPLLPASMGRRNDIFLLLGAFSTLSRGILVKSNLPKNMFIGAVVGLVNAGICIYKHSHYQEVPIFCRIISWLFLIYSLTVPFYITSKSLKMQVEIVFFSLSTAYIPLCTSYEGVFIVLLGSQLMLTFSLTKESPPVFMSSRYNDDLTDSFQYALAILLYTLFTFFGTGNNASVSSFDPNVMRCFITTFSPWIIMGLVVLKLFIPMLLSVAIIYGTIDPVLNERKVFIAMLFICDLMGLNFLYLVRNKGSWLEIGTSISHFVIMEVTTLVLVVTTHLVKVYLKMRKERNPYVNWKIK